MSYVRELTLMAYMSTRSLQQLTRVFLCNIVSYKHIFFLFIRAGRVLFRNTSPSFLFCFNEVFSVIKRQNWHILIFQGRQILHGQTI